MSRLSLLAVWVFASWSTAYAQNGVVVTATQANGIYRYGENEFRILALGQHRLKVQFDGVYVTAAKGQNMGYATGEATIEGNVATFIPPDTQSCKIILTFLQNSLKATQDGSDADCAFGHNVDATGTYRKIRGGQPKFESRP
jgi:hypothetical protein